MDAGVSQEAVAGAPRGALPSRARKSVPEPTPMGARNWTILPIRASSSARRKQAGGAARAASSILSTLVRLGVWVWLYQWPSPRERTMTKEEWREGLNQNCYEGHSCIQSKMLCVPAVCVCARLAASVAIVCALPLTVLRMRRHWGVAPDVANRVKASSMMAWLEEDVIRPVPWQKRMAGGLSPAMMAAEKVDRCRCARRRSMASLAPQISACWELSTCGRAMLHAARVTRTPSDPLADLSTAPAPDALCPCTTQVAPSKVISRQ